MTSDGGQIVYLNGRFLPLAEAAVPVLDRGFIFGDGIYEYVPVYGRRPFAIDGHLRRLQASLDAVRIPNPHGDAEWIALIAQMIERTPYDDQGVYLQVTRGVAPREHGFPKTVTPTVFMMSNPLVTPSAAQIERGVTAMTLPDVRWLRCDIKSISLLGNVLARQAATEAACAEAVMLRDGFLTEGSASNVFAVKNGTLLAPPKDNLILPGITYDVVLDLARANGIPVETRRIAEAEVRAADELWLSSSSKEVLAVVTLDGKPIGNGKPGPLFRRMHTLYQGHKRMLAGAALGTTTANHA